MELSKDLLTLSEEALPELSIEEEIVGCVLYAVDEPKEEDLEDAAGLGTIFREPPEAGILNTGAPLPERMKLG